MTPDPNDSTPAAAPDGVAERLAADAALAHEHVRVLETEYAGLLADSGVIQEDRDSTRLLLETARQVAAAADRAIKRFEDGTYGRCVRCGENITLERLEALPEAETCVSCG